MVAVQKLYNRDAPSPAARHAHGHMGLGKRAQACSGLAPGLVTPTRPAAVKAQSMQAAQLAAERAKGAARRLVSY